MLKAFNISKREVRLTAVIFIFQFICANKVYNSEFLIIINICYINLALFNIP